VGLLVLDGWDVTKGPVKASGVVQVDLSGGGVFDVCEGLVRAFVEDGGADALGFVQPIDGLHQGVAIRVADRPDRGPNLFQRQVLSEGGRGAAPAVATTSTSMLRWCS